MGDKYTDKAKSAGLRARSAYKLMAINQKYSLIKPNDTVLDLGCWPGGWLIVATRKGASKVVGIDLKAIDRIQGVTFIQGDVTKEETLSKINGKFDVVLSDMAPQTSGNHSRDVGRSIALAEIAFEVAKRFLKPGGKFLVKVFQGAGYMEFVNNVRKSFSFFKTIKPEASKLKSREMYVLGIGFR
ncbi:MAG: RlmE family RNA methyltransferase [Nanoarchaeota archaeon]|nr:RlmE family RNA methyltransferase [Nanoarchaeota archaeon]MBU4352780.1 RlmE family RNA methyltransferase [Nanoarchaeota archaeon]MBU4456895.1 RlmE family RNA methyltransferase [Nanoarchaeota archaeon]